jgi:cation diffusion facilitator family transporter
MVAVTAAADNAATQRRLVRLMWLSIAAAVTTIALKTVAWAVTGSVGLLSDAAESVVNLVAAIFALIIVQWAARPPDEDHAYGHEKADYLSAGVEGGLILIAAATIGFTAIERLSNPQPLTDVGIGVAVAVLASGVNLAVARLLIGAGRQHASLTLEADGRHLMTDVWTSVGVVAGVVAVAVSGWDILDPLIALAVAANILLTGLSLVRRSTGGMMDRALTADELARVDAVLMRYSTAGPVQFHALRSRRAGRRAFLSVHILVPGDWTVKRGHDLVEQIERDLLEALGHATVFTHLEPLEDPASFADTGLDRSAQPARG